MTRWLSWLAWVACAWAGIWRMLGVYEFNPDYSHGYLVPVIAGYAIWRHRDRLRALPQVRSAFGLILILPAVAALGMGFWYDVALQPGGLGVEFVMGWGLWLSALGLAWITEGRARFLALTFAWAYLLFGIPIPESWTGIVTLPMRRLVTVCLLYTSDAADE